MKPLPSIWFASFVTNSPLYVRSIKKPDFYHILIEYEPDKVCLKSKSLKEYLQTYWNKKVFTEQLAADIIGDLVKALDPIQIKVELQQQIKVGIETSVIVLRKLRDYKECPS